MGGTREEGRVVIGGGGGSSSSSGGSDGISWDSSGDKYEIKWLRILEYSNEST